MKGSSISDWHRESFSIITLDLQTPNMKPGSLRRDLIVEALLFEKIVTDRFSLTKVRYGNFQPDIQVRIRIGDHAPIRVNRKINSGYWDEPTRELTNEVKLLFVGFFDFDPRGYDSR